MGPKELEPGKVSVALYLEVVVEDGFGKGCSSGRFPKTSNKEYLWGGSPEVEGSGGCTNDGTDGGYSLLRSAKFTASPIC